MALSRSMGARALQCLSIVRAQWVDAGGAPLVRLFPVRSQFFPKKVLYGIVHAAACTRRSHVKTEATCYPINSVCGTGSGPAPRMAGSKNKTRKSHVVRNRTYIGSFAGFYCTQEARCHSSFFMCVMGARRLMATAWNSLMLRPRGAKRSWPAASFYAKFRLRFGTAIACGSG